MRSTLGFLALATLVACGTAETSVDRTSAVREPAPVEKPQPVSALSSEISSISQVCVGQLQNPGSAEAVLLAKGYNPNQRSFLLNAFNKTILDRGNERFGDQYGQMNFTILHKAGRLGRSCSFWFLDYSRATADAAYQQTLSQIESAGWTRTSARGNTAFTNGQMTFMMEYTYRRNGNAALIDFTDITNLLRRGRG